MTAASDTDLIEGFTIPAGACECTRDVHHPGSADCSESPICMVRLRHACGCPGDMVLKMCQNCYNEAERWATYVVGRRCRHCRQIFHAVTDVIGPVVTI